MHGHSLQAIALYLWPGHAFLHIQFLAEDKYLWCHAWIWSSLIFQLMQRVPNRHYTIFMQGHIKTTTKKYTGNITSLNSYFSFRTYSNWNTYSATARLVRISHMELWQSL